MRSTKSDLERLIEKPSPGSLKPADVCKILRACLETGVARLEYDGLVVEFGKTPITPPPPVVELTPAEIGRQETKSKETLEEERRARRDEILAQLDILDPVLYEELAEKGALTHGSTDTDRPTE